MAAYPTCQADTCDSRRRRDQIMCRKHWAAVPRAIQQHVYATYDRAAGIRQSAEWLAAIDAAIASLRPAGTEELPL